MKHFSLRLIVTYAAMTELCLWTRDVDQAYIQSKESLSRPIYLRPPNKLQSPEDVLWKQVKPLYGLLDLGTIGITSLRTSNERD